MDNVVKKGGGCTLAVPLGFGNKRGIWRRIPPITFPHFNLPKAQAPSQCTAFQPVIVKRDAELSFAKELPHCTCPSGPADNEKCRIWRSRESCSFPQLGFAEG